MLHNQYPLPDGLWYQRQLPILIGLNGEKFETNLVPSLFLDLFSNMTTLYSLMGLILVRIINFTLKSLALERQKKVSVIWDMTRLYLHVLLWG